MNISGTRVATLGKAGDNCSLWDVATGKLLWQLPRRKDLPYTSPLFSDNGNYVLIRELGWLSLSNKGVVHLVDARVGETLRTMRMKSREDSAVAFTENGSRLATINHAARFKFQPGRMPAKLFTQVMIQNMQLVDPVTTHLSYAKMFYVESGRNLFIVGINEEGDQVLHIMGWNVESRQVIRWITYLEQDISSNTWISPKFFVSHDLLAVHFSKDRCHETATNSHDESLVMIFSLAEDTQTPVATVTIPEAQQTWSGVIVREKGFILIRDGVLQLWDSAKPEEIGKIELGKWGSFSYPGVIALPPVSEKPQQLVYFSDGKIEFFEEKKI